MIVSSTTLIALNCFVFIALISSVTPSSRTRIRARLESVHLEPPSEQFSRPNVLQPRIVRDVYDANSDNQRDNGLNNQVRSRVRVKRKGGGRAGGGRAGGSKAGGFRSAPGGGRGFRPGTKNAAIVIECHDLRWTFVTLLIIIRDRWCT